MGKICLKAIIAVFVLICSNKIQSQTGENKLNQVELMKKFSGSWKTELSEGRAMIWENTPFGTAMTGNTKFITRDTVFDSNKYLWGYDKINDKIIISEIFSNTPIMEIDVVWFTSDNTVEGVLLKDISDPENALIKFKFDFKSQDSLVLKYIQDNKIVTELAFVRGNK